MRCSAPGSGFFAPDGAGCLRRCISNAPKVRVVSDGPFFSVLPEKRRFQPRFLSRMRKKAPLTVERKHRQGGFASEQTPHSSSCPPLAADRPRPFRCSSFSHTNRFAGFAWEPCPFAIPLKRPRRGLRSPSLDFPRSLIRTEIIFGFTKRGTDAFLLNWRGSRNTLRLFRMPFAWKIVTRDTQSSPCRKNGLSTFIRQIFNGREQSGSHGVSCAWETRFYGRPKGVPCGARHR